MEIEVAFLGFMELIREDPCIGPSHISLFAAMLVSYKIQDLKMPVSIFSRDLMKQAKISAIATYHHCLKDLIENGYIRYTPSFDPAKGSLIYILRFEK